MTVEEPLGVLGAVMDQSHRYLVEVEIECLAQQHGHVMAENDEYLVIRGMADQIPNVLYEIGLMRDEVLRESGGTSGRDVDLDYFDLYYLHMVVWNKKNREVAGTCRLGQADIIIKRFGHAGLFTGTMFHYSPLFLQKTGPSLELGKFVMRKKFRGFPSPAALLLTGIGYFISYNPHYKSIIGTVSLSSSYGLLSQQLILSFLRRNAYDPKPARHVEPLAAPPVRTGEKPGIVKTHLKEMGPLSRFVSHLEADRKGVPRDVKHYVKLGGKLIGVSPGPSPGNVLTGLMLIDLTRCTRKTLRRFMGGPGTDRFLGYHGGRENRAA